MAPNFHLFLDKCHSTQNWYKNLSTNWTHYGYSKNIKELQESITEVRKLKNVEKTSLENLDFSIPLSKKNEFSSKDLHLLKEIAEKATDDKIGELLFMMVQPTNFLLRPSRELGPDIIGFCETKSGEKVMVLLSLSFWPDSNPTSWKSKFEQNRYKQEPTYFYSREKKEGEKKSLRASIRRTEIRQHLCFIEPKNIMDKITLPPKVLMLCASMPETKTYEVEEKVDSRPEAIRIYITLHSPKPKFLRRQHAF
eukprot:TRINITY_DN5209_c0_g1_i2.p2 TRINITY_DN5209_c0_g1~~TRINITY_DN5209_c0_g1_i2.p2  ORF type:complete len:252 (+),score=41.21 TRINITY_DN5209_c0_g1_i2:1760-2515(+)